MSKKKPNYWTKKKLFTVRFKGRKPRALLWRKSVYREWFEYARLAQGSGRNIPREFGDLRRFDTFEEWWRHPDYGFELFCEPYMDEGARVLPEPPARIEQDNILITINLNADREKLIQIISKLLKENHVSEEYSSLARYQPSKDMKYLKPDKLKSYRRTWLLTESGMRHEDIVKKLKLLPDKVSPDNPIYEDLMKSALRKVSRHKRSVNDTLSHIERGTFP